MEISKDEQSEWLPDVVVLGGGGAKGFLELGALFALEQQGFLDRVKTWAGVSIGSAISLLFVAGYSLEDIITHGITANIFQAPIIDLAAIQSNKGILSNAVIRIELEKLIKAKLGKVPTLEELYMATSIDYDSISYNLSKKKVVRFNRTTHPHISCVEAALLSMNLPFVFHAAIFDNELYADGGLGNPYPVDLYDDGINNILGMYIESGSPPTVESGLGSYAYSIIQAPMDELRKKIIGTSSDMCQHIRLTTSNIDTVGISHGPKEKAKMLIDGYNEAVHFLEKLKI